MNLPFTTKCSPIPTAHLTKCTNLYFFGNGIFGTTMLLLPGTSFFSFTCLIDAGGFLLKTQLQNKDFGQHHSLINSTCSMCDLHQINISAISPASQSKFGWHHQIKDKNINMLRGGKEENFVFKPFIIFWKSFKILVKL